MWSQQTHCICAEKSSSFGCSNSWSALEYVDGTGVIDVEQSGTNEATHDLREYIDCQPHSLGFLRKIQPVNDDELGTFFQGNLRHVAIAIVT